MSTTRVVIDIGALPQLLAAANIEQGDPEENNSEHNHPQILHCVGSTARLKSSRADFFSGTPTH
jgi:hypothetical protein